VGTKEGVAAMATTSGRASGGTKRVRMSGPERRESILAAAMRVFASGSYTSATTSSIAREAGITEPVLYHHFRNKADLYSACLDQSWDELRAHWDKVVASEERPSRWVPRMAEVGLAVIAEGGAAQLWLHAMTEASEDPEARERVADFTTRLHAYVADVVARAQAAGGLRPELDPRVEAWMFLTMGILRTLSGRLGGIIDADFPAILAARQRWFNLPTEG
jgi:AcrR family transcriptional regulator